MPIFSGEETRMKDSNVNMFFFSLLFARAQAFILSQAVTEVEVECKETRSEKFFDKIWSPFENHESLPMVTKDIEPKFHLYKRGSSIDHLAVLIHGFGSRWDSDWWNGVPLETMKKMIFENDPRKNLAVLIVDWKEGASLVLLDAEGSYNKAVANTRYIGLATERYIQCLQSNDPNIEVHCIGHSLGAHVCGFLANEMESSTGSKLLRVTGLDPAGPQFTTRLQPGTLHIEPLKSTPRDERLDETDAKVVDIIHTDGNQWGTMIPIGDIDFYVGKSLETLGTKQAACESGDLCDHSKAYDLFSKSLESHFETGDKSKEILECQLESKLSESELRRGRIFGVLDKEEQMDQEERDQEVDEWEVWGDDWAEEEEVKPELDLRVHNCRETEAKPRFGYFYQEDWEKDNRGNELEKETNKPKKTLHGGQVKKAHFFEIKVLVIVMMVLVIVVTVVVAVAKKGVDIKAVLVESRYMAIKREEKEVKNKQDYQEDKRGIKSESEE